VNPSARSRSATPLPTEPSGNDQTGSMAAVQMPDGTARGTARKRRLATGLGRRGVAMTSGGVDVVLIESVRHAGLKLVGSNDLGRGGCGADKLNLDSQQGATW